MPLQEDNDLADQAGRSHASHGLQEPRGPAIILRDPVLKSQPPSDDASATTASTVCNGLFSAQPSVSNHAIVTSKGPVPPQPAEVMFAESNLERASGCPSESDDGPMQAQGSGHVNRASAAGHSRVGSWALGPHTGGCGLQDLPPEVVMHILASLPLKVLCFHPNHV